MNYKGEATAIRITDHFVLKWEECTKCLSSRNDGIDDRRCYSDAIGLSPYSLKSKSIQDIDPIALCKYFERNGWKYVEVGNKHVKFYQLIKDGNLHQVGIPLDTCFIDYADMMSNAVEQLAMQQGKCFVKMMLIALRLSDETKGDDE